MKVFCRNYTPAVCAFCGGTYKKLQKCFSDGSDITIKNLKHCCSICNSLIAFTTPQSKYMKLCVSQLSQLDIIRKTVDYIIKHKTCPDIETIDDEAEEYDISCGKFISDPTNKKYKNMKIFFPKLDISKVLLNLNEDEFDETPKIKNKYSREIRLIELMQKITEQLLSFTP
jgi:hypothetical protein